MTNGKSLPEDVIAHWPEILGEVTLNVIPPQYLHSIKITFKNKKVWEVNIGAEKGNDAWDVFESRMKELIANYEDRIENIDFKLDTEKLKKDIIKNTKKFLNSKKLR